MLEELDRELLVLRLVLRQLQRDLEHGLREERHPRGAVGLLEIPARRQRLRAIEDANVVEAEEPALEDVAAVAILAIHPPREVEQQLVEYPLEERAVALPGHRAFRVVREQRRPRVHRWVHITEIPLVRGNLSVRMHVSLAKEQVQLLLREIRIDHRERQRVKGEVPRRVPRVFPLV